MAGKHFKLPDSVDKYLKFMEFVKSSSPLTLKSYRKDLEQAFGDKTGVLDESELLALGRNALNSWAGLSLSSRNRKSSVLKSLFSWAYEEKMTERDLSTQIYSPRVPKKLPHFISVDEAIAVLSSYGPLRDSKLPLAELQDKVLFLVLYGGGLRISEACHLMWKDVQLSVRSLRLMGKGQKERLVILPQMAVQALAQLQTHAVVKGYVFGGGEEPLNPRVAYEWVRTRGAKAMLMKPLHPHALRHSFATHLLSSGANLRTLQELLGHESLQATEKYTHLGVDQLARTLESHHPLSSIKKR